jgi:hypothetical protein
MKRRRPTNSVKIQTKPVCLNSYTRHWFKMKGRRGQQAPMCQRPGCGHRNARWEQPQKVSHNGDGTCDEKSSNNSRNT